MPKDPSRRDFLSRYLGMEGRQHRLQRDKYSVVSDKWDREDLAHLLKEIPEAQKSQKKLGDFVDTGEHAWGDSYFSLVKAIPEVRDAEEVEPKFWVNRHIEAELLKLKEHEELRSFCSGDPVASALADITIEPTVESLFDQYKEEQKLAQSLQNQQDQLDNMLDQERDLEEMFEEWVNAGGDPNDSAAQEPRNFQENMDQIQRNMEKLRQQMDQTAQNLQNGLESKKGSTQAQLRRAVKQATEDAQQVEAAAMMWGQEPGSVRSMDAKKRMEFAKKVQTSKFKRVAKLIGQIVRLAMAQQSRKTEHGRDEIHDITQGNDLSRVVPSEFLNLLDPDLELEFYSRYVEHRLLQYELRGVEKVAKGGIIVCGDESGSMSGDKEIWEKAVTLAFLHIARKQKRPFYRIGFGSPGELVEFDFRDPNKIDPDGVLEMAGHFMNSGTDYVTPLSRAIDILKEEYDAEGRVKGDIVMITDGMCGVPDDWLKSLKEEQARIGFRIYGISIGGNRYDQPLFDICDHRVCTVVDLVSGNDIRDIFAAI